MRHKTVTLRRQRPTTLALSGGGVSAIGTLEMLSAFQHKINRAAAKLFGENFVFIDRIGKKWVGTLPINAVFETIAGTSAGSIIAAGIRAGISIDTLREIVLQTVRRVFPGRVKRSANRLYRRVIGLGGLSVPWYDSENLYTELRAVFRNQMFCAVDRLIIIALTADDRTKPVILKSWKPDLWGDWRLWEGSAASSSAPIYLAPFMKVINGKPAFFSDGGTTGANNPSMVALIEDAKRTRREGKKLPLLASFGTGYDAAKLDGPSMKKWGAMQYIPNVYPAGFMSEPQAMVSYQTDFLLNYQEEDTLFYDFDFPYAKASGSLDDSSPENVDGLIHDAISYMPAKDMELETCAYQAVSENFSATGARR